VFELCSYNKSVFFNNRESIYLLTLDCLGRTHGTEEYHVSTLCFRRIDTLWLMIKDGGCVQTSSNIKF